MISPAPTIWPPNRFTPSRCALESRPLRLEDAPFLCAMWNSVLLLRAGAGPGRTRLRSTRPGRTGLRRTGPGRTGRSRLRRTGRTGLRRAGPGRTGLRRAGLRSTGLRSTGLGGANASDSHLRVLLPVAQPAPVAGLVLVVDHVDLGASCGTHDLGSDLVAAQLRRVADDLAVVDNEHGWQRHAGSDLAS